MVPPALIGKVTLIPGNCHLGAASAQSRQTVGTWRKSMPFCLWLIQTAIMLILDHVTTFVSSPLNPAYPESILPILTTIVCFVQNPTLRTCALRSGRHYFSCILFHTACTQGWGRRPLVFPLLAVSQTLEGYVVPWEGGDVVYRSQGCRESEGEQLSTVGHGSWSVATASTTFALLRK